MLALLILVSSICCLKIMNLFMLIFFSFSSESFDILGNIICLLMHVHDTSMIRYFIICIAHKKTENREYYWRHKLDLIIGFPKYQRFPYTLHPYLNHTSLYSIKCLICFLTHLFQPYTIFANSSISRNLFT